MKQLAMLAEAPTKVKNLRRWSKRKKSKFKNKPRIFRTSRMLLLVKLKGATLIECRPKLTKKRK